MLNRFQHSTLPLLVLKKKDGESAHGSSKIPLVLIYFQNLCFLRMGLWRRKWKNTPVFLPRESHGQKSLAGYSPWGRKESDTTERPNTTHRMDLSSIKNFSVSANQTVNIHFLCTILYYFYKVLKVTFRQNSKLSYCICNTVLEVLSSNCQSWLSQFDANICKYVEL